ncbi:histone-like protein [Halovenus marina]|uniref:histone-like protein n=1 Tax=Halovenus marina TaxID=3396621 RepID=UPI003F57C346
MARNTDRPRRKTRQKARNAVDSKKAKAVLSEAADEEVEPDDDAAETLREAAAEETAEVAEAAARRARRRGRKNISSEDIGQANERHQDREERGRRR